MARRKLPFKTKKTNLTPLWIILGVVAVIGLFVYQGIRQLSGNPILKSQDEVPRLTGQEARVAVEQQGAILLDVRSSGQYEVNHIEGSLRVPLDIIDEFLPTLDKEAWYITYCT